MERVGANLKAHGNLWKLKKDMGVWQKKGSGRQTYGQKPENEMNQKWRKEIVIGLK
jgi:hypothetical protein